MTEMLAQRTRLAIQVDSALAARSTATTGIRALKISATPKWDVLIPPSHKERLVLMTGKPAPQTNATETVPAPIR